MLDIRRHVIDGGRAAAGYFGGGVLCGCAVTRGLHGSAVSRDLRAFHSFHFGFDITFVVEIGRPYK
jgi:hypothetical protein